MGRLPPPAPARPLPQVQDENSQLIINQPPQHDSKSKKKDKNKKKPRITKADIGNPTNFKTLVHVGADGIHSVCDSEEIRLFLEKAGIPLSQLKNPGIKKSVENFVRTHNVQDVVRRESMMPNSVRAAPPPPKSLPPELPVRNNDTLNRKNRQLMPMPNAIPTNKTTTSAAPPPVRFMKFFKTPY